MLTQPPKKCWNIMQPQKRRAYAGFMFLRTWIMVAMASMVKFGGVYFWVGAICGRIWGSWVTNNLLLVGGLDHEFYFPYTGNNHPNWLSYFSEGLKPPTRLRFSVYRPFSSGCWGCDLVGYEGERGFEEWSLNRIERGKGVERCRILVDQLVHGWWLVPGQCLISKSRKL